MNDYPDSLVEAARYAVLRRMAPAIRHSIVGKLHPIALISGAMAQRMGSTLPDVALVRENVGSLKNMARTAMQSFTDLITWLAPEENAVTPLGKGIEECLDLLHTEFGMRGFTLENNAKGHEVAVSQSALRNVLSGSLLAATDAAKAPADLVISAQVTPELAVVSISVKNADRVAAFDASAYRLMEWREVEALADDEAVKLSRESDCVKLHFNTVPA